MTARETLVVALVVGALLAAQPARANESVPKEYQEHELYGSYGLLTAQDFGILINSATEAVIDGVIDAAGGTPGTYKSKTSGTGAIGLGYNSYLSPRWSMGLLANYEGYTRTYFFSTGTVSRLRDDFITLMFRTDFRWVNAQVLQLYSSVAVGGNYIHSYELGNPAKGLENVVPAFQLTPLGLRLGTRVGLFVELGFGWNGLAAAGISGRF